MKYKHIYNSIILVIASFALSWAVPAIVKVAASTAQNYPFLYYSSIIQRFIIKETVDNKTKYSDTDGNSYTREQYDTLTPMLSYRQLMLTNSLPDTILGVEIDPRIVRAKTIVWRYAPRNIHQPVLPLYLMYESMSGRSALEPPEDVFRLKESIEFVNKLTNVVNIEKSNVFQQRMIEEDFMFPAKQVWGNLSARKAYDEGYFVLDSRNQLFHVKMVNGRPYVRNTMAGANMEVVYFNVSEVADKSIYGYLVNKVGEIYTLGTDGYHLTKFDIPTIDINKHSVMVMGNLFYWMVYVTTPENCTYNILEAGTLKQHDQPYIIKASANRWDQTASCIFPVYLSLSSKYTDYVKPELVINWGPAFILSLALSAGFLFTAGRKRNIPQRIVAAVIILIFGIPGLITCLIIK
jgi:hypothetical protein